MKITNPEILPDSKRKLTNRGARKIIYHFPSLINKKLIDCESGLEWKLCHLFEMDHASIQSYESQAHKLIYYADKKKRSYTPDFLVNRSGADLVVEVKPVNKLQYHLDKLQQVKTAYEIIGKHFVLLTDAYIEKQPRLDNARKILRHARQRVTRTSLKAIVDLFKCCRTPLTIRDVIDQLAPKNVQEAEIYKLIYVGIVRFDPEKPLNRDSVIWFSNDVHA